MQEVVGKSAHMWTQLTKHKFSFLVERFPDSYVEAGLGDAWCE